MTLLAIRASAWTGSRALKTLTAGLGVVTTEAIFSGEVHQFSDSGIPAGIAIQLTSTALEFAVIAYSLYATGGEDSDTEADVTRIGPT
jgi:hypothetical protein